MCPQLDCNQEVWLLCVKKWSGQSQTGRTGSAALEIGDRGFEGNMSCGNDYKLRVKEVLYMSAAA